MDAGQNPIWNYGKTGTVREYALIKQEDTMKIYPVGDMAISVDFGNVIEEAVNDQVMRLKAMLGESNVPGVEEMLPSYRALMICYDPNRISYAELSRKVTEMHALSEKKASSAGTRIVRIIPCCYGGEYGEDLQGMEELTGLSQKEIINIHAGTDYKIYMLGFLPGFVYLGGMDERIAAPRLESPRVSIPAGSVGIGGKQTGVYPIASPGGWRLIGTTPVKFYDPQAKKPILCNAGEYIRFQPISKEEYQSIESKIKAGEWEPEIEKRTE